jgi:hypothetical protein
LLQEPKEGSGAIFPNKFHDPNNARSPLYTGTVFNNGRLRKIALWKKYSKKDGSEFFSVSITELEENPNKKAYNNQRPQSYNQNGAYRSPKPAYVNPRQPQAQQPTNQQPAINDEFGGGPWSR